MLLLVWKPHLGEFMLQRTVATVATVASLLVGCASTNFKAYEGPSIFVGKGGTKTTVDGIDIWDNGEPPRKFRVLGIVEDERPGGVIPMMRLRGDIVKKAKEVGADAVIQLSSSSQITGYHTTGSATAYGTGNAATAYGSSTSVPLRQNTAKFAVIKYVE
jgi:hypothetical protein